MWWTENVKDFLQKFLLNVFVSEFGLEIHRKNSKLKNQNFPIFILDNFFKIQLLTSKIPFIKDWLQKY